MICPLRHGFVVILYFLKDIAYCRLALVRQSSVCQGSSFAILSVWVRAGIGFHVRRIAEPNDRLIDLIESFTSSG